MRRGSLAGMAPCDQTPLMYVGIDEAGYGPRLGPLCVGMSAFRVSGWAEGEAAPDLWKRLGRVVCRDPAHAAAGRVPVNDSKRLKLANHRPEPVGAAMDSRARAPKAPRHPLTHLEAGVLAFLYASGRRPACDESLLRELGGSLEAHDHYAGPPIPLPQATTPERVGVLANALAHRMGEKGVELLGAGCACVCERAFNDGLRASGNKSAVSFGAVAGLLRTVWREWGAQAPRVVVDRQGGRAYYTEALEGALPGVGVRAVAENDRVSRYEVTGRADDGAERRMVVQFEVEADSTHFPTALASMCAKLVRELAMERFNRCFAARLPGVAPTAGYGTDARRWIEEARPHLGAALIGELVRRA